MGLRGNHHSKLSRLDYNSVRIRLHDLKKNLLTGYENATDRKKNLKYSIYINPKTEVKSAKQGFTIALLVAEVTGWGLKTHLKYMHNRMYLSEETRDRSSLDVAMKLLKINLKQY